MFHQQYFLKPTMSRPLGPASFFFGGGDLESLDGNINKWGYQGEINSGHNMVADQGAPFLGCYGSCRHDLRRESGRGWSWVSQLTCLKASGLSYLSAYFKRWYPMILWNYKVIYVHIRRKIFFLTKTILDFSTDDAAAAGLPHAKQ